MLEFNFLRTAIEDSKCFLQIIVRRKKFAYCGVFTDLLGSKRVDVIEKVVCKELVPVISFLAEKVAFYRIPEEKPFIDNSPEYGLEEKIKNLSGYNDNNELSKLKKRGTFILESLNNFIEKKGENKLVFIIAQNPIWDITVALTTLREKNIPLYIIRIPCQEKLRDRIAPKNKKINEGVYVYDGENLQEFCSARLTEALGAKNKNLKFVIQSAQWVNCFEAGYKSEITNEERREEISLEIKKDENEKKIYISLEKISNNALISYYEEGKKIGDKKLTKEIAEKPNLQKQIEKWLKNHSTKWKELFNKMTDFDAEEYKFKCDCDNTEKLGFKCARCGKINPSFINLEEDIEKNKPKFIVFYIEGESDLKIDFITEENITEENINKKYNFSYAIIEFNRRFWKVDVKSNIILMSLRDKRELTREEMKKIEPNPGNVYKIMIEDKCYALVIDNH